MNSNDWPALVTRYTQAMATNQSAPVTSVELSPGFRAALLAHGVDLDAVTVAPDGEVTARVTDGRVTFGAEGGWYTATYTDDDSETMVYEGRSLSDLARTAAPVWP